MTEEILRENIIRICKGELGVTEFPKGSNRQKYGAWYGFNGVAWCCIVISWIFDSVGRRIDVKTSKGFSHTDHIVNFAKKNNLITKNPKKGDLALIDFDGSLPIDHIGIFEKFSENGKEVFLYEGNTSSGKTGSQNNGEGFFYKKRPEEKITLYISVSYFLNK